MLHEARGYELLDDLGAGGRGDETLTDLARGNGESVADRLCRAVAALPETEMEKLSVVVWMACPEWACEAAEIAGNLSLFEFTPGVKAPEE